MEKKYAAIDIGSNSVRLMLQGETQKYSVTTRLGFMLAKTGRLDPFCAKNSAAAIERFAHYAEGRGFTPVAYATSAVRDAQNRGEFLELVKLMSGIEIDVLSGEREAAYAYEAACGAKGGLMDIGGASMQLVCESFRRSFPLGCVRAKDIANMHTDAPEAAEKTYAAQRKVLEARLQALLEPCMDELKAADFSPCTGVGGTINALCSLAVDENAPNKLVGNGYTLSRAELEWQIERLDALGENRARIGVLSARHDVILYGAALLAAAMDILGIPSVTASLRDGLDGYLEAAVRGELDGRKSPPPMP